MLFGEKSRSLRRVLMGALTGCILASAIFGIEAFRASAGLTHARDVQRQAEHLGRVIVDAETGERGYILTGNPAFLEPFETSRLMVLGIIGKARESVAGDPDQVKRLDDLVPLVQAKFKFLAEAGGLEAAGRHDDAVAMVRAMAGKHLMDDIRSRLDAFIAAEDDLLAEREHIYTTQRTIALFTLLFSALALAAMIANEVRGATRRTRQLAVDKTELERLVGERTAELERERVRMQGFLKDVNHRVGNSLALATSLLNLHARKSGNAEVQRALHDSAARIRAIAAGQRRLQIDAQADRVAAKPYFENFLAELSELTGATNVKLVGDFDEVMLSGRQAVSYIILTNELVTNALKHAFPPGGSGTVTVRLKDSGSTNLLIVEDDGRGMVETDGGGGVGSTVTEMMLRALNAEMQVDTPHPGDSRPGHRATITIPVAEDLDDSTA